MAYEFLVTVEGTKIGKFSGETTRSDHQGKLTGIAFEYGVDTARDTATGQASGRRTHHPVSFVKQWGAATPQFFQAAVTNESLKSVLFEFLRIEESTGEERVFHTIRLTNANVSAVEQFVAHNDEDIHDARPLEKISLVFQRIEISNLDGQTTAVDEGRGR